MDPAQVAAWQRCREQVLSSTDWPRGLWFAAVEDALRRTFGADSPLLADYRADVAELRRLERAASGSYHDEQRMAQLEAQIGALVRRADESVPDAADEPLQPRRTERPRRMRWHPAGTLAAGVLIFLTGAGGAAVYYEMRLMAQVEQQLERLSMRTDDQIAALRSDLERQFATTRDLNDKLSGLHAELDANVDSFGRAMVESLESMTRLSEDTVAALERRLLAEDEGVNQALSRLRVRAGALGQELGAVDRDVAALERRLPELSAAFERLSAGLARIEEAVARATKDAEMVRARAPEMLQWLASAQEALEGELNDRRARLGEADAAISTLETHTRAARERLQAASAGLDGDLHDIAERRAKLEAELTALGAGRQQVDSLLNDAAAGIATAQQELADQIAAVLAQLAEKADLAVLRGEDVMRRAEAATLRRFEAAGEQMLETLGEARDRQLAALADRIAAARREVETTQADLFDRWERLDQSVAERQGEVLASLDGYARTIETHIEDLLKALDVTVAKTGG